MSKRLIETPNVKKDQITKTATELEIQNCNVRNAHNEPGNQDKL